MRLCRRPKRRDLLLLSTLALLFLIRLPAVAEAAEKVYRVGVLAPEGMHAIQSFKEHLHELGWIEGKNIRFDYRSTQGDDTRQPALAAELGGASGRSDPDLGNTGDARGKTGDGDDPDRHRLDR